jgi:hypothetical protein
MAHFSPKEVERVAKVASGNQAKPGNCYQSDKDQRSYESRSFLLPFHTDVPPSSEMLEFLRQLTLLYPLDDRLWLIASGEKRN